MSLGDEEFAGASEKPAVAAHVARMRTELKDLSERLTKLGQFVTDNAGPFKDLPHLEQRLMVEQYDAMQQYHRILSSRYMLVMI